jgi:hypothetical protein
MGLVLGGELGLRMPVGGILRLVHGYGLSLVVIGLSRL